MFIINTFSICFGHHYAHLQENKTCVTVRGVVRWFCRMWLVAVVRRCVVGCEHSEGYCSTETWRIRVFFGYVIHRLQAFYTVNLEIKNRQAMLNKDKKEFCVCSKAYCTSNDIQSWQHFHRCDWTLTLCSLNNYVSTMPRRSSSIHS